MEENSLAEKAVRLFYKQTEITGGYMTKYLRKCTVCGKYTILKAICPYCSSQTRIPHPAKFSLTDNYGKYRRRLKKLEELKL